MLSSEANEISESEAKKTMSAEHIAESLKQLGFDSYVDAVMEAAEEFKKSQAVSAQPRYFVHPSAALSGLTSHSLSMRTPTRTLS